MVAPSAGRIVLVPFPFSDLSQAKLRPAIVLANAGRGDWILCQITSNPYGDARAVHLSSTQSSRSSKAGVEIEGNLKDVELPNAAARGSLRSLRRLIRALADNTC